MLMTQQQIFDTVAKHLLTQKNRSVAYYSSDDDDAACRYRGQCGMKCAVGCLIPDELYSLDIEGYGVYSSQLHQTLVKAKVLTGVFGDKQLSLELLRDLQLVHDKEPVATWHHQLSVLAFANKLNTSTLDHAY